MTTILLWKGGSKARSPKWWRNYTASFSTRSIRQMNTDLHTHSAKFVVLEKTHIPSIENAYDSFGDRLLVFETDEDATAFILRFS